MRRGSKESMSTQEVFIQQFARLFDHYHHALQSDDGVRGVATPSVWNSLGIDERDHMVAAARLALMEMEDAAHPEDLRKYYKKPGECEWGC